MLGTPVGNILLEGNIFTATAVAGGNNGKSFNVFVGSGNASGSGGNINLISGGGGDYGNGGDINLFCGPGGLNLGNGGNINIISGNSNENSGGEILILSGSSVNSNGGNIVIGGGSSSSTTAGTGGSVYIVSGFSGSNSNGSTVIISAGNGGSTIGSGGSVYLNAGSASSNGAGGNLFLNAGHAAGGTFNGGNIILTAGVSSGSGSGGRILLRTRNSGTVDLLGLDVNHVTQLRFFEAPINGSNFVALRAPSSLTSNIIWTLPSNDGTLGQVLTTNGSGVLGWTTPGYFTFNNSESFEVAASGTTANNMPLTIYSYSPGPQRTSIIETYVSARSVGSNNSATYIRRARVVYDFSSFASVMDYTPVFTSESITSWDSDIVASGTSVWVRVIGQDGVIINWYARIKIVTVFA